jgi:ABC-type lipoprotein export system ATPase subunit
VTAVVHFERVVKNYAGLRPLRVASLEIQPGERVALGGLDAGAAEVFVNLVTGATLPDEGEVRTFGRSTREINSGDAWLASLDRFGIVSPRAVMLEGATLEQNLAMPFTLEIDPVPAAIVAKVRDLAAACGIDHTMLTQRIATVSPIVRVRAHLARAVALDPSILLLEHPTANIGGQDPAALGRDVEAVADPRHLTVIAVTMDEEFAQNVAHRPLSLNPVTGALVPWKKRRRWL